MGKHKTERTEQLKQAARQYAIGRQVQDIIEQHNFNRLVAQGVIVEADVETWSEADNEA